MYTEPKNITCVTFRCRYSIGMKTYTSRVWYGNILYPM